MDLPAVAETSVEVWTLVNAKLIARKQEKLEPEIKAQIFSEAMKLYMTQIINEKRHPPAPTADKPADDEHCAKCGREFTQGELGFLENKKGEDRVCYHCSH